MPTVGVFLGNKVVPVIDDVAIGCTTECSLELTSEVIDATCKDNDGARQVLPGQNGWTFSFSGLQVLDDADGVKSLTALQLAKTIVPVTVSTGVVGDPEFTGSGYISSVSLNYSLNEVASYDVTIEGTTPLAQADISA
jgi:predicted secreted protein